MKKYMCWTEGGVFSNPSKPSELTLTEIIATAIATGQKPGAQQESHDGARKSFWSWRGDKLSLHVQCYPASRKVSGMLYPTVKKIDACLGGK